MTIKEAWEYLHSQGINTEEELNKALKNNYIEIGFFTSPVKCKKVS